MSFEKRRQSGALSWSEDVAMTTREIDGFLSGRWLARLATLRKDGYPHVSPLWYYWDGVCLYMASKKGRAGCKHLLRDPRCSVVVDIDARPTMGMQANFAKAVVMTGDAELIAITPTTPVVIDGGPLRGEHPSEAILSSLFGRYLLREADGALEVPHEHFQPRSQHNDVPSQDRAIAANDERVLIKLRPLSIRAWDFSKAPFRTEG